MNSGSLEILPLMCSGVMDSCPPEAQGPIWRMTTKAPSSPSACSRTFSHKIKFGGVFYSRFCIEYYTKIFYYLSLYLETCNDSKCSKSLQKWPTFIVVLNGWNMSDIDIWMTQIAVIFLLMLNLYIFSSYTKAQTFADCVGHELPYGWEECVDGQIGIYYVDHINSECDLNSLLLGAVAVLHYCAAY